MSLCLLTVIIPFIGAFFSHFIPPRIRSLYVLFTLILTFICALLVFLSFKISQPYFSKNIISWFNLSFFCDSLSIFMAVVSSFVAVIIALYSLDYMRDYSHSNFYFWMVLFVAGMMGLLFSANLLLMYCFWEITAVCSWKLIGFYRRKSDVQAADRAFLTTFFGASLLLVGIIIVYLQFNSVDILHLKGKSLGNTAAFLLLVGILAKSAQLPLQTWLPDAGVAPTPVTALLHAAVLVKIGVYAFSRFFNHTFLVSDKFFNSVIILAVATIITAAAVALREDNIKRILAYSTISQLGYILFVFALNVQFGFWVGLLYILAHSIAKAGLFLCAGIIEHSTHTKDINELGGLIKCLPFTALSYILCAFSIIGLPPFLGFWPKFLLIFLSLKEGYLLFGILAIVGAFFTLLYLFRLFDKVFLGEVKIEAREDNKPYMVYAVLICGFLSLTLGISSFFWGNLLEKILL